MMSWTHPPIAPHVNRLAARIVLALLALPGCDAKPAETTKAVAKAEPAAKVEPAAKQVEPETKLEPDAKPVEPGAKPVEPGAKQVEPDAKQPASAEIPASPSGAVDPAAAPVAPVASVVAEMPVVPWAPRPLTVAWAEQAGPATAIVFEPQVDAGVIGRSDAKWFQVGADGGLAELTLDRDPTTPVLGVWPDDAWFVESRMRKEGPEDFEIQEVRLMKLRGGDRWVPQAYRGEQWWHPGTDDWFETHMSTRSGMLVYPGSLSSLARVAGKVDDPILGPCRGKPVDFVETSRGKVYLISSDDDGIYAQIECEDEACVATMPRKFPAGSWTFGRRVARGKFSVSVLADRGDERFVLNNIGKDAGWRLDALPDRETLVGMWAGAAGSLWTWNGTALRLRDTDGGWHDVAVPEGFEGKSVAMSGDRKKVWFAGEMRGTPAIVTTNAELPGG